MKRARSQLYCQKRLRGFGAKGHWLWRLPTPEELQAILAPPAAQRAESLAGTTSGDYPQPDESTEKTKVSREDHPTKVVHSERLGPLCTPLENDAVLAALQQRGFTLAEVTPVPGEGEREEAKG